MSYILPGMDNMKSNKLTGLLGACLAALLSSCGSDDNSQSTRSLPYQVAEAYNVGDSVFVRALAYDKRQQRVWVGTSVGAMEIDAKSYDLVKSYTREDGLANEFVFSIFVDSKGDKWFGTDGGGMSQLKGTQWKTYMPMHGLADYWVYSFTEQKDGTLWVGTWAGLNRIDGKTGVFKTYLTELINEWVYGLDVDKKDNVWIGTEGGVNMFDGKKWYKWTHEDGLGAANADGLQASANTGLGTRTRHDLSVMAMGMETYNPNYVFDVEVAHDSTVWAATWGGGVAHYDGKKWRNYTMQDGLSGNIVFSIAEAKDGTLWFGTNRGLSRFDGKKFENFAGPMANDVNLTGVYDVIVLDNGEVWAGTRGGVVRLSRMAPSAGKTGK